MRIQVIDDEAGLRHTLSLILRDDGHEVATSDNGTAALEALREHDADLILCDVRMPGIDGLEFLERYRAAGGGALVIMMSAYGDDDAAVEALRRGAYDYLPKPFKADQVLLVIRKAIEREHLRQRVASLEDELLAARGADDLVGRSAAIRDVLSLAVKVARHPSTVLITGESGTGKELLARLLHRRSARASGPFVAVNCAAIPESLLESELFGHVKGSFTGATGERHGLFEEAASGTLFLDEIGEIPVTLQAKLLRALQEGEVRPVGSNVSRPVDVRVIAATARDLEGAVRDGTFRADLFYRINVVRLHVPPLRDRREDIAELVRHFLSRHNRRLGTRIERVTPAAMQRLLDHPWPGNVRELENVLERAMVVAEDVEIDARHLPALSGPGAAPARTDGGGTDELSVKKRIAGLERELIRQALERTSGNRSQAAKLLELSPRALLYKIREYGLD